MKIDKYTCYQRAFKIRLIEENISAIYSSDLIKSPVHLSIGQELISVVLSENLEKNDIVFGTYRSHAIYLALGGSVKKFYAELFGKSTGCNKGLGGSMHLSSFENRLMGASAIVASTIPQSVGYSYSFRDKHKDIVVCFFGEGSTSEGNFHESLNMASVSKTPILFVCENNSLAIDTPAVDICSQEETYKYAKSHNIKSFITDDSKSIEELASSIKEAVEYVRNKRVPGYLEIKTRRLSQHVGPLLVNTYSNRDDIKSIKNEVIEPDLIEIWYESLSEDQKQKIQKDIKTEINSAIEFANKSNPLTYKESLTYVYQ